MPIYLLVIVIIISGLGIIGMSSKCQKKFKKKLFSLNQTIPIGISMVLSGSVLYYTKLGNINMEKIFIPAVFIGIFVSISVVNGYRNTNIIYGTLILFITLLVIFAGSIIFYGIGKSIIFVIPAIGVFLAFQTIVNRKKRR